MVDGDALSCAVACASILAKTHRDALMRELDRELPGYGFARHKGYGTAVHRAGPAGPGGLPGAPPELRPGGGPGAARGGPAERPHGRRSEACGSVPELQAWVEHSLRPAYGRLRPAWVEALRGYAGAGRSPPAGLTPWTWRWALILRRGRCFVQRRDPGLAQFPRPVGVPRRQAGSRWNRPGRPWSGNCGRSWTGARSWSRRCRSWPRVPGPGRGPAPPLPAPARANRAPGWPGAGSPCRNGPPAHAGGQPGPAGPDPLTFGRDWVYDGLNRM